MLQIDGYKILTQIYESINSFVYRGIRLQDNQAVILKVLKEDYPTPSELTRYKQEYEITRNLNTDGVVKAYGLEAVQRTLVIILEDFGASSLRQLMDEGMGGGTGQESLPEFLNIAIKTSECLGQIHSSNVIHKDINPANIVFNPETGQLKIIDFGISTVLSRENPTLKNPNVLEGTLAYMSPEQTGRMNRSLDYRSDFYSLGVTFYELLTGQLPFETTDALELVHCHIAKVPSSPHQLNPEIPKALSDIVMKLMAKTAEERYQSAWGIKADLEECLNQLETKGEISEFPLGSQDISDKFQIPQKLYGREVEVETLLTAFGRVASTSQSKIEMMLVAGYSGIGKSALVQEIYKPITSKRGYFISGKFDQFQRNIPYSAVVDAFQGLVRQLLSESSEQLNLWREKLRRAFGSNGQVIIDVIPEVELIVGKQPAVPELGPTESQNRFNLVFGHFIRAFCSIEHPLVIFLDDLQWADSATLKLIELMMTDADTTNKSSSLSSSLAGGTEGGLFLIGAYRDNEVNSAHPLMITLDSIRKEGATANCITLAPLHSEPITQLIADTLHSNIASVKPLAELVVRKTEGNPFFVNEFLKTLHAENLLTFDLERHIWQWDISNIEAKGITDNVVELMIGKVKKLPESTQQFLRLAACVGASFDLNTLSIICKKSAEVVFADLFIAVQSGLILPLSELDEKLLIQDYKFGHDRIQQAAYALIDEERKKAVHLQIGRLLLANVSAEELLDKIFEIVDHLNLGQELITDESERFRLAQLNLAAGKKAKEATAYASALQYLTVAMNVFSGNIWGDHYEFALTLHHERAETEYLNGHFEQAELLIYQAISRARLAIEKAKFYGILIMQYTMRTKYKEAIEAGKKGLKLLGISLPEENLKTEIRQIAHEVKQNLAGREIASLIDAPEMVLPDKKIVVKLLTNLGPSSFFLNIDLYAVVVGTSVNHVLKYGFVPESCHGISGFGIILCSFLEDYKSGYEFGLVSLKLSEKYQNLSQKCQSCHNFSIHINHWVKPLKSIDSIYNDCFQSGLESGDFPHAGYNLSNRLPNLFYQAEQLETLRAEIPKFLQFTQKTKNQLAVDIILGFEIVTHNLLGLTSGKFDFHNEEIDEAQYLEICQNHKSVFALCNYLILKTHLFYLYDNPAEALNCALSASNILGFIIGLITVAEHNFYYSLTMIALYPEVSVVEQKEYWQKIESNQNQMKIWADNCPENFFHKYLLVEAEMARLSGKDIAAMDLYDLAIKSARENEFIQNEALGNELAAKFWLGKGREEFAQLYMKKAHYGYQLWGAKRKVEDLEEKYPQLLPLSSAVSRSTSTRTTITNTLTGTESGNALDLATVMKASQAISGEIMLDKLLGNLMKILIENAGAQVGYLILENLGQLLIEAEGAIDLENVAVLQSIPIENRLPAAIINYVFRTRESVVLSDATVEGNFTQDFYIQHHQPKSILCFPLINQGQLVSIIYLENNLTKDAFTPERLEVLKILSAQAAISIENARLYQTLEDKVTERTAQLAQANAKITALNEKLKAENLRMSAELEVTKQLQQMVLPKREELESIEGLEIAAFMEPADEVGGDYYDVLQQNGSVKISIGDVTGHGLESGVVMLMAQTAVRTLQESHQTDPVQFLDILNRTIYRNIQRINPYKNLTLSVLDYADGTLSVSGQHEEIIVVRSGGKVERLDTRYLGFPLGLEEEIAEFIAQERVQLNPGDVVVLYTDGITEAFDINQQQYGVERLCDVVARNCDRTAQEIKQAVIADVRQHIGSQKVFDDITLLVLKQK